MLHAICSDSVDRPGFRFMNSLPLYDISISFLALAWLADSAALFVLGEDNRSFATTPFALDAAFAGLGSFRGFWGVDIHFHVCCFQISVRLCESNFYVKECKLPSVGLDISSGTIKTISWERTPRSDKHTLVLCFHVCILFWSLRLWLRGQF